MISVAPSMTWLLVRTSPLGIEHDARPGAGGALVAEGGVDVDESGDDLAQQSGLIQRSDGRRGRRSGGGRSSSKPATTVAVASMPGKRRTQKARGARMLESIRQLCLKRGVKGHFRAAPDREHVWAASSLVTPANGAWARARTVSCGLERSFPTLERFVTRARVLPTDGTMLLHTIIRPPVASAGRMDTMLRSGSARFVLAAALLCAR